MTKYHIVSGNMETIVTADDVDRACEIAIKTSDAGTYFGRIIQVSEKGFDEEGEDDEIMFLCTESLFKRLGLNYSIRDKVHNTLIRRAQENELLTCDQCGAKIEDEEYIETNGRCYQCGGKGTD